jgi:hypothetical protein
MAEDSARASADCEAKFSGIRHGCFALGGMGRGISPHLRSAGGVRPYLGSRRTCGRAGGVRPYLKGGITNLLIISRSALRGDGKYREERRAEQKSPARVTGRGLGSNRGICLRRRAVAHPLEVPRRALLLPLLLPLGREQGPAWRLGVPGRRPRFPRGWRPRGPWSSHRSPRACGP